jgi:hypothetical protein
MGLASGVTGLLFALCAGVPALGALTLAPSRPAAAASTVPTIAVSPPNSRAYIFDTLGSSTDNSVAGVLREDSYHVTVFRNSSLTSGTANLTNFLKMVGAGVAVITTLGSNKAALIVQLFDNATQANDAYSSYLRHGFQARWLDNTRIKLSRSKTIGAIALTFAGIQHFFGSQPMGIVYGGAAYSQYVGSAFDAETFVGYVSNVTATEESGNESGYFDNLGGDHPNSSGIPLRDSISATSGSKFLSVNSAHLRPVTLSPAVSYAGAAGSLVPGITKSVYVDFDTAMAASAKDSVTVSGCGAQITKRTWQGPGALLLSVTLPSQPNGGKAKLTVDASSAVAGAPGWPNRLDGNQPPSGQNGRAPNGTDYVTSLTCAQALNLYVSGTLFGHKLAGDIVDASVSCTRYHAPDGKVDSTNHINGGVPSNGTLIEVGIEDDNPVGSDPLGTGVGDYPATFDWLNPFTHIGVTSGNTNITEKGGYIKADFGNGGGPVSATGSWICPGS